MRAEELPGWLAAVGVADGAVSVGEEVERAWCVRPVPAEGDRADGWEVFWCEEGGRFAWTRFDDEATACFALFGRLAWTRVLRGALGPVR